MSSVIPPPYHKDDSPPPYSQAITQIQTNFRSLSIDNSRYCGRIDLEQNASKIGSRPKTVLSWTAEPRSASWPIRLIDRMNKHIVRQVAEDKIARFELQSYSDLLSRGPVDDVEFLRNEIRNEWDHGSIMRLVNPASFFHYWLTGPRGFTLSWWLLDEKKPQIFMALRYYRGYRGTGARFGLWGKLKNHFVIHAEEPVPTANKRVEDVSTGS